MIVGAGLLWSGWCGFNAGLDLAADVVVRYGWVNTLVALVVAWLIDKAGGWAAPSDLA